MQTIGTGFAQLSNKKSLFTLPGARKRRGIEERMLALIDIHNHLLPGMDDGSDSLETSLEMLKGALRAGVTQIFVTPHLYFYDRLEETVTKAGRKLTELQLEVRRQGLEVRLYPGCEVFLHPELPWLENLNKISLGQKGEFILVEVASGQIPNFVEKTCFDLLINGVTPILAHPERNLISTSQLNILRKLSAQGVILQIEAASYIGLNGKEMKKACQLLLAENLAGIVASDAHNRKRNFEPMQEAYRQISKNFSEERANFLFCTNPEKILTATGRQTNLKFK
jgi:protein-tyrosine phosphatase